MGKRSIEDVFGPVFAKGVYDIDFAIRRGSNVSVHDLAAEAVQFQEAIDAGRVRQIASVD